MLVAHDRWFLEAVATAVLELEAGRSTYFPGEWHVWRREKAARLLDASKSIERYNADIARLQRFVDRFRYKKSKAKQAQAKLDAYRPAEEGEDGRLRRVRPAHAALAQARVRVPEPAAQREDGRRGRGPVALGGRQAAAGRCLARDRARRARCAGRPERRRARPRCWRRCSAGWSRTRAPPGSVTGSSRPTSRSTRPSWTSAARCSSCVQSMTGLRRPEAQNLLGRFLFSGWESHEKAVRCSRAVSGGGWRSRSWSPRARTSSSSTSRRTTSTSRAAKRWRRRWRTSRRRCCSSPTTARCSTRSPNGRWRSRTGRSGATTAAGRTTSERVPCGQRVPLLAQFQSQRLGWKRHKESHGRSGHGRGGPASSSRSRPRSRAGGGSRRSRAEARRRLGRPRTPHGPPGRARRAPVAPRPLGDAVRAGASHALGAVPKKPERARPSVGSAPVRP